MEHLGVDLNFSILQKASLLGTARILRRVLDTRGCRMQLAINLKSPAKHLRPSNIKKIIIEIIYLVYQPTAKFTY